MGAAVVLAIGVPGCGVDGGDNLGGNIRVQDLSDVRGEWVLEHAYSSPQPLVEGVEVRLFVRDDGIGLDAGCNQIGGEATLDDSRLVVDGLTTTVMACSDEAVMDQEKWLYEFLQSEPVMERGGPVLTLNTDVEGRDVPSPSEQVSLSFSQSSG